MNDPTRPAPASRLLPCALAWLLLAAAAAADDDPRRPPAMRAEGVPVVPDAIFEQLRRFQEVRGAGFAGWHPGGEGMLVRTRFGSTSQLHRVERPGGRRQQITFYREPVRGRFVPRSAEGAVLLSMSRGGDENDQLYLFTPEDFRVRRLTDGKSRNQLGPFSRDGRRLIFSSNRRNGKDTDLYLLDVGSTDPPEMLLETDGEYWYASDFAPDGTQVAAVRFVSVNESYPALLTLPEGELRPLAGTETGKASYGNLRFAPDGRRLYLATDADGEFRQLLRRNLADGAETPLTADVAWDVEEVEVAPESGDVAVAVNADGASRLYLLQERDGVARRRQLELPLGIVRNLEFSPDGTALGFTLSRPDAPPDAYSLRLAAEGDAPDRPVGADQLVRWTYSELGGLDPRRFVVPRRIAAVAADGRRIPAYYFAPPTATAERPAPVIVMIHGGPEGQYRPYFSPTIQYYVATLGAAVICPNVRGSSGYGKTWLRLDNGRLREESVGDIGALLDWIGERDELDARRVAVSGGSYGGYMVLASLIRYGDRLRAGIDRVGIANFITFLERTSPYRRDLRRVEYGDERDPEMRAFFERINPTTHAARIRSALLVEHGVNDPRVPFSEAEQIAAAVRAAGREVWTLYAENEGHGFAKRENRDYATAVEVFFLQRQLGLGPPPRDSD